MPKFEVNRPVPERLFQDGRPTVQEFPGDEKLFHRFNHLMIVNGWLCPSSVRFPDFSVNREQFCEPLDVLLPSYENWGVAYFSVDDIPGDITTTDDSNTNVTYSFYPYHLPLPDNYSHSEVRTSKNGNYDREMKIKAKTVKLEFRMKLSEKIQIIKDIDKN